MPTTVQFRRGTTAQNDAFTGAAGELSIDTDKKAIRIHDNSTAGGEEVVVVSATQTLTNKTLTSAVLSTGVSGSAVLDEDDMSSNSATQLATQQSIKAYVDSQVTAQDLDVTSDSGTIAIDLDSETLTIAGGTGIDSSATTNTVTLAIDSTVTTLTGTQTLTNKTLTSPTINSATIAMGTNKITGLGDPTSAQDAATKAYIDSELSSLSSTTLTEGNSNVVVADSGTGTFTVTIDGTTHSTFAAAGITLSQGAFVGNLTGNADTATTLATARTIGGVSFNGSANINLPGVNTTGNQNTTGSAATLTTARTIGGVSFNGSANINLPGVNTAGNQNTTGNATTATTATNATNVYINNDDTGDTNCPILFSANSTAGYKPIYEDSAFYFNNTANTLVVTNITGTASAAKYADLAERYTSDSNYEAGTVLVFGGDEEVTESTQRLDKRIAGIVSTDPAYLMNSALENSVAVGLQGRVPCKVVGEIRKGDLMVSSATPGHAEAWRDESNPPAGSVIGKALENKTGASTDVIEVVVGRI